MPQPTHHKPQATTSHKPHADLTHETQKTNLTHKTQQTDLYPQPTNQHADLEKKKKNGRRVQGRSAASGGRDD